MELLVLITYDVSTQSAAGRKRLRKVAKECVNYGQRVQNSVFECVVDNLQFEMLKSDIDKVIDKERDSVRYYNLGNSGRKKVIHIGNKHSIDVEDVIII